MDKRARAKEAITKIRHCIMNDKCELIDCGYYGALSSLEELSRFLDDMKIVVRCKDCKYSEQTIDAWNNRYFCKKYEYSHEDDWFCADGEEAKE